MRWLRTYLQEYEGGEVASHEDLERIYVEVNIFALCSHFYWGLWALVQAHASDIDFDYMGYAIMRFTQYERTKDHWIKLFKDTFKN